MRHFLARLSALLRLSRRPQSQALPLGIPDAARSAAAPPPRPPTPSSGGLRMDSLLNSLSSLGGAGDKGAVGHVDMERGPLSMGELDQLLRYNGYARRIVDIVANDTTRKGWVVQDSTRDTDPMQEEDKRLGTEAVMCTAMQIARTYGGCNIMGVFEELPPTDPLNGMPLPVRLSDPLDMNRIVRVLNLIPLDTSECTALEWDTDPTSPNFRRPLTWSVSPQSGGLSPLTGTRVHWSRMLYVPGRPLPPRLRTLNRGYDFSVLQSAWDAIRNLTTVDQAGATHSQELSIPVLKVGDLRAQSAAEQSASMAIRMSILARTRSLLNMILLGPEEDYQHREISLSGFDKVAERAKEAICAAVDMPIVVLFGEAPGGLNADGASHRTLWDRVVAAEWNRALLPALTRLYQWLYHAKAGPTGGEEPIAWKVVANPLDELTEAGQIDNEAKAAATDKTYVEMGVLTAADVRQSRFGPKGWSAKILPAATPAPDSADADATPAPPRPSLPAGNIPIRVQIPAGDLRRGVGDDGKPWAVRMPCDYGEIPGTRDLDGEPTDVLVIPGGARGMAFVVEQLLPVGEEEAETEVEIKVEVEGRADAANQIDEHKVILGATSIPEVMAILSAAYGESGLWGQIYPVPETQLLPWLAAHMTRAAQTTDGIDLTPPDGVRAELKRGLAWHEEGKSGRGLVPATVRWARRLAAGEAITPAKARKMRAWLARYEVDKKGEGYKPGGEGFPSPGRVAWALWGGDPAVTWSNKIVEQLERASRA